MLRRNVHGTYALKVDMSLYSEKYPELGKYRYGYSKRLVIDSLLAEFNQCYTEGRIDEIRQMLVEKEK